MSVMTLLKAVVVTSISAAGTLGMTSPHDAPQRSCTLVGGIRAPAELRVYVELNNNAPGNPLRSGTIGRDESWSISSPTDRIIYFYRYSPNDAWSDAIHAWCTGSAVTVP